MRLADDLRSMLSRHNLSNREGNDPLPFSDVLEAISDSLLSARNADAKEGFPIGAGFRDRYDGSLLNCWHVGVLALTLGRHPEAPVVIGLAHAHRTGPSASLAEPEMLWPELVTRTNRAAEWDWTRLRWACAADEAKDRIRTTREQAEAMLAAERAGAK